MIKFRSWISSTREFTYFEDGNYTRLKATKSHVFNWLTAGQYTGLKDKNGKEIYEGDIIKGFWLFSDAVCVVRWDNNSLGFTFHGWKFEQRVKNKIEIVGSIHETPELLEASL